MNHLTRHQHDAIQRARDALQASMDGAVPPGVDPAHVTAQFWRGFLERTLLTLFDELEDDGTGGTS